MLYEPLPIGRVCRNCNVWKPCAELKKLRSHSTGVDALCHKCHNKQTKERRASNPDKYREMDRQYRTKNIEKYRARDKERSANPKRHQYMLEYGRKYHQENKAKHNEQSRQYSKKHPEVSRKSSKKWGTANRSKVRFIKRTSETRRRARKLNLPADFTNEHWLKALDYFNNSCAVCERPIGLWHTFAQDHWIPLSDPSCPGTVPSNIIPLCHGENGCNNSKESRDPVKWLTSRYGARKAKVILKHIQDYFEWVKLQE